MSLIKRLLFMFCGLFLSFLVRAQILSHDAVVSVITCGATQDELYAAFGHSAVRVYDSANNIDLVYNYGTFDFDQPHFYLNFARGFLYYQLSVYPYSPFKNYYIGTNRSVYEQTLNLNPLQRQKILDFMQNNALPENRTYRYDYFYDNCATRIRDLFEQVLSEQIHFDGSYVKTHYSIRQLTDIYLKNQQWGDLGIDVCLGLPMDKIASPYEYMFLPDYIKSGFDHASILDSTGQKQPLVRVSKSVYEATSKEIPFSWSQPLVVFSALLLLVTMMTVRGLKKNRHYMWIDAVIFGVVGLLGVMLGLLWGLTDHNAAANNFNLLWAMPTHIFPVFLANFKSKIAKYYFKICFIIYLLTLLSWPFLPQQLHIALVPIVMMLALRSFVLSRK